MLTPDHDCACTNPGWIDLTTQLSRGQTKFAKATVEVDATQAEMLALHGEWLASHGYLFAVVFVWLAVLSISRRPR